MYVPNAMTGRYKSGALMSSFGGLYVSLSPPNLLSDARPVALVQERKQEDLQLVLDILGIDLEVVVHVPQLANVALHVFPP